MVTIDVLNLHARIFFLFIDCIWIIHNMFWSMVLLHIFNGEKTMFFIFFILPQYGIDHSLHDLILINPL